MDLTCLDIVDWDAGGLRRASFVAGLREACTHPNSGFFYLRVTSAIDASVTSAAIAAAERFFELPLEQKLAIDLHDSPHYRGFAALGTETTAAVTDLREYIELGEEEAATPLGDEDLPAYMRMGIGPNQWPAELPQFEPVVMDYFGQCKGLAAKVMEAVSTALELPPTQLAESYTRAPLGAHVRFKPACYRSRAYAATADVGTEEQSQGLGAHTDFGFLSLLLQNEVAGLEVQRASDGAWLAAPPMDGTLVVNLGEMAELVSGGALVASTHRVLPPPPGSPARVSIPVFFNPSLDSVVEPVGLSASLQALADARKEPGAVQMDGTDDNQIVSVYGDNWVKGFSRSQPAWFARHLPDVYARQQELQPTSVGKVHVVGKAQLGSKL